MEQSMHSLRRVSRLVLSVIAAKNTKIHKNTQKWIERIFVNSRDFRGNTYVAQAANGQLRNSLSRSSRVVPSCGIHNRFH
jgi:hypothetical protein